MKRLKLAMMATVLVSATTGAIVSAHASKVARGPHPALARDYYPGQPREAFMYMDAVAAIQERVYYHSVPDPDASGECNASTNVCTYRDLNFLDPLHPDIRQYNAGDMY